MILVQRTTESLNSHLARICSEVTGEAISEEDWYDETKNPWWGKDGKIQPSKAQCLSAKVSLQEAFDQLSDMEVIDFVFDNRERLEKLLGTELFIGESKLTKRGLKFLKDMGPIKIKL